jgi:hypothetical protein
MVQPDDMLDDEDYPAYTMGRAAEIIGCSPDSGGGHRRYCGARASVPHRMSTSARFANWAS